MNLYTDDNPETTLKGLGFKNKTIAMETVKKVENYFDAMKSKQSVPGLTPSNVRPQEFISNETELDEYYQKQKMYRILGMLNRAKGMIHRVKNTTNIKQAINIFEKWMNIYKMNSKINK